jgi:hypothetical protein
VVALRCKQLALNASYRDGPVLTQGSSLVSSSSRAPFGSARARRPHEPAGLSHGAWCGWHSDLKGARVGPPRPYARGVGENWPPIEALLVRVCALAPKTWAWEMFGRGILGASGILERLCGCSVGLWGARRKFAFLRAQMTSGY